MNGYTFEQFLDTIKSRFDVALAGVEAVRPQKKGEFGMYADGNIQIFYRIAGEKVCFCVYTIPVSVGIHLNNFLIQ